MAFLLNGFYPDQRGAGHRVHTYTSGDLQSVVESPGYFDTVSNILQVGDRISCFDSTTNITYALEVTAISSSGVVTTNRPSVTAPAVIHAETTSIFLTSDQSGSTILLDRSGSYSFLLPTPIVGLKFRFVVTVIPIGSFVRRILTDLATTFFVGGLQAYIDASAVTKGHLVDGTSCSIIQFNGTTRGALVGTVFEVECISATVWFVTGLLASSGTPVNPFLP